MEQKVKIIVDGDACPVKEEIIFLGRQWQCSIIIYAAISHYTVRHSNDAKWIFVDNHEQSVDMHIINAAAAGDIIVTQDYGLASILLNKKCRVIHHAGYEYTKDNIDFLLDNRYTSAKIRKAGGKTRGPRPFSQKDRENFVIVLETMLMEINSKKH